MTELSEAVVTFLLNSLWQVPMVCVIAQAGARFMQRAPGRLRYRLWFGARVLAITLPAGTTLAHVGAFSIFRQGLTDSQHPPLWVRAHGLILPDVLFMATPWMQFVAWCYLAFLAGGLVRLCWGVWKVSRLPESARRAVIPAFAMPILERCRAALGITNVSLRFSPRVRGPMTLGVWAPQILVPEDMAKTATEADWALVLSHEMAHVRRKDFAKNAACQLFTLPISFHPAALLMKSRMAEAREQACDELATERCIAPESYARTLLSLAAGMGDTPSRNSLDYSIGMFDGNVLEERIRNLLRGRRELPAIWAVIALAVFFTLLAGTCVTASAFAIRVTEEFTPCAPSALPVAHHDGGASSDSTIDSSRDNSGREAIPSGPRPKERFSALAHRPGH